MPSSAGKAMVWFNSVVHTFVPTAKKKGRYSLKPHFEVVDTIYIAITEATTTTPFILAVVKDNVSDEHIIVAVDGYEIKELSGTEGMPVSNSCAHCRYRFYVYPSCMQVIHVGSGNRVQERFMPYPGRPLQTNDCSNARA